MAGDRVYRDMKVFVEGDDGKKRPVNIGYCYDDGEKVRFQITALPPPGARTNWSGVIEVREERGARPQPTRGNGAAMRGSVRQPGDDDDIPFG